MMKSEKKNEINHIGDDYSDEENGVFRKYLSLLSTLKGHEEFLLDEDGMIISSNLEATNITGYEEYEVLGKHISLFYPSKEKALNDLKRAIKLNQTVSLGLQLKKKGVTFWSKTVIRYIPYSSESKIRFKVTIQDNTHRALSNIRVRTIRDEYLNIFNNPFVGVFKFRMSDFKMLTANQKMQEIGGCENDSSTNFRDIFDDPSQFESFMQLLKDKKRVEKFEFQIGDPILSNKFGIISARYFTSVDFVEGVVIDISEQYNQRLELERVNSELDTFVYHASHDLRAPLSSIAGLLNLCDLEDKSKSLGTLLNFIRSRVFHMDSLLRDLVSISLNSQMKVYSEPFWFENEIGRIVSEYATLNSQVRVEVNVRQTHSFVSDPSRIRIILRNLIANSFQYTNPEKKISFIRIEVSVEDDQAKLQIRDNGIGIDQSLIDRVFDMFFRGTEKSTGSGLGLFIVKSYVNKLMGKISLKSTLGKGTTFFVTLPGSKPTMSVME